jgi:signal transduction histidine kinase
MKNTLILSTDENSDTRTWSEQEAHLSDPTFSDPACQKPSQEDFDNLQSALKKMTLMTGMAVHDILNKISAIYGYRALLDCEMQNHPELHQQYRGMMEAVDGIRQHAEFTRFYLKRGMTPSTWIRLTDLVQETVTNIPFGNVNLVINVGNAEIYADRLMKTVFSNLIENALSHGGTVSEIQIIFSEDADGATIIIEDDGCGIPAKNKSRIFEYGFGKHTGMGLFLTRSALKTFNFSICEVGQEGRGARFEIRVPPDLYRCNRNT